MFNDSTIQRRQTARESTGPLKNWLQDHPRNPYPTKAEKVMLALISGKDNIIMKNVKIASRDMEDNKYIEM